MSNCGPFLIRINTQINPNTARSAADVSIASVALSVDNSTAIAEPIITPATGIWINIPMIDPVACLTIKISSTPVFGCLSPSTKYIDENVQTIITTTDLKNINKKTVDKAKVFEVYDGNILERN